MFKRFCRYYRPHAGLFALDLFCALILAGCDLVYPLITRRMLNDYIPDRLLGALLIWAGVLLLVYLVKYGMNYFVLYWGHIVGVRMQADMRRDAFEHLEALPLSYFDANKTGAIMSRVVADLMDVSELAHHGPEDLFLSAVMLVGSFILMGRICMPLTLIVFSGLPLLIYFTMRSRKKMMDAFTASRVEIGEVNATLENAIAGIRVSKAYTNDDGEAETFSRGNARFQAARGRAMKSLASFNAFSTFVGDFLQLAMYVAGGLFCYFGRITLGDFTAFVLYITLFMNPIKRLISFVEQYQNGVSGFRRFCEIMDEAPEADAPSARRMGPARGEIAFRDVAFSYAGGQSVLSGLSFRVPAGRTLALVGPSGGGKSTICNLIPRFYEIDSGAIEIDGEDIREVTRKSLRRNIGIVAQDVFLFNASIRENIAYGLPGATDAQIAEAARLAGIDAYIASLPEGYDTAVGERGVRLSGGQRQRVSIARVFLKNPPILILDEATSALDNVTERLIQRSLDALCRGRTTIVVAHRLTTVMNADEILVITDEGVAERGTHAELLEKRGVYAGLWRGFTDAAGT